MILEIRRRLSTFLITINHFPPLLEENQLIFQLRSRTAPREHRPRCCPRGRPDWHPDVPGAGADQLPQDEEGPHQHTEAEQADEQRGGRRRGADGNRRGREEHCQAGISDK